MEAIIKKNSTQVLIVDPRQFGDYNVDWNTVLQNAVVTFSLFDVETGCFTVANRPGEIIPGGLSANDPSLAGAVSCGDDTSVTRIAYKFRTRDTKLSGIYRGTFQVNVIGEETVLAVPSMGDIQVVIAESGISRWTQGVYTGMPSLDEEVAPPSGPTGTLFAGTWAELNTLATNQSLLPGKQYLLTDYQTVHRIPTQSLTEANIHRGPIEPLILEAVTVNSFSHVAKSTVVTSHLLHYDFTNSIVACGDSFDLDTPAGQSCQISSVQHTRPGYITYRQDPVKKLSAYFDFRSYLNRVDGIQGSTFAPGVANVTVGEYSGNIIITAKNVEVGENSQGLHLTNIANRIRIGSDVHGFSTTGVTLTTRLLANSSFELADGGLYGTVRNTLKMQNDVLGFDGVNVLGLLPAGCVTSALEIVGEKMLLSGVASMGLAGSVGNAVFGPLPLADIAKGVFTAQVSSVSITQNTGLTLTLLGSSTGQGRLHVRTSFVFTGGPA